MLSTMVLSCPLSAQTISLQDPAHVEKIRLVVDKSRTLETDLPYSEVMVANSAIADVVPLTDQTLYVVGKSIGLTRLTLLDTDKQLLGVVELEVSFDVTALRQTLQRNVPDGHFRLRTANGRLILGGSVAGSSSLARAIEITEQFTANCRVGAVATSSRNTQTSDKSAAVGGGASAAPFQFVPPQAPENNGPAIKPKCFSNALSVRAAQQVMLEVRFVEARRDAGRDLGLRWSANTNRFTGVTGRNSSLDLPRTEGYGGNNGLNDGQVDVLGLASSVAGAAAGALSPFPSGALPFGTFITRLLDNGSQADLIIEALERRGVARRLAEPNLVALSGDTANFLAGGEFPFPVPQERGQITIDFKKFGIGLAFTPTVLNDGQINLKIEPEVSDLDPTTGVSVLGTRVPGLTVRRASTTVELRDGQSFAIAGLLASNNTKQIDQLPWLGDVPVLGALFRSSSYQKNESDLVIIVTPRLVQPAKPGQKLITPLDKKLSGNDRDFFLRGKEEVSKKWPTNYGHYLDDDYNGWAQYQTVSRESDRSEINGSYK